MILCEFSKRLKKFKHKVFWTSGLGWKGNPDISRYWVTERWREQHQEEDYRTINIFSKRIYQ